jgi:dipeptidase
MSGISPVRRLLPLALLIALVAASTAAFLAERNSDLLPKAATFDNCTSILVGRLASVDGSTMTSQSCDSGTDRTWIALESRTEHPTGAMAPIWFEPKRTTGPDDPDRIPRGEIPQVSTTWKFMDAAYPIMNEHQLAIGETTTGGKRELYSDEGLIDAPELYRLVLERAKTAREAIAIADELTKTYGYADWGECFTFADPQEVWHFEILGPGRGRIGAVWAAGRIPDDHVGVSANAHRIRQLDLSDPDRYQASDNVFSLAEEMGWWDPDSGESFEFCYAYASRNSIYSRRREWRVLSLLAPTLGLDPEAMDYPLSVRPEQKVSVQDLLAIFRDTYEGTPFDMTNDLMIRGRQGEMVKSPLANPFMSGDMRALLDIERERTICSPTATYLQVTQSRGWLPDPIGGLVWLGYDNPATTPHLPFYIGIEQMPDSYMVDGRREFSRDCAWWAYRRASKLSYFRYEQMKHDLVAAWEPIEAEAFARQEEIEAEALRLYRDDPAAAMRLLTAHCHDLAGGALTTYWELGDRLWVRYNNAF